MYHAGYTNHYISLKIFCNVRESFGAGAASRRGGSNSGGAMMSSPFIGIGSFWI